MPTLRERSTALVNLAVVELFGVTLAVACPPGAVPRTGELRADHAALLFAFAAWPLLAVRAARRRELEPAVRLRYRR